MFGTLQSLTTISDLKSSELIHLAGLPLLEYLEVGDCSQWLEEADYCNLGQLPHVRHLRLEQGPCSSVIAYLDSALGAITSLQHVELVTFVFDAPMERLKASGLKRLLVIPRYTTEVSLILLTYEMTFYNLQLLLLDAGYDNAPCIRFRRVDAATATADLGRNG